MDESEHKLLLLLLFVLLFFVYVNIRCLLLIIYLFFCKFIKFTVFFICYKISINNVECIWVEGLCGYNLNVYELLHALKNTNLNQHLHTHTKSLQISASDITTSLVLSFFGKCNWCFLNLRAKHQPYDDFLCWWFRIMNEIKIFQFTLGCVCVCLINEGNIFVVKLNFTAWENS